MRKLSELKTILNKYVKDYNYLKKEKELLMQNEYNYEKILNILYKCIDEEYTGILNINSYLSSLFGNKYNTLCVDIYECQKLYFINKKDSDEYKVLRERIIKFINEIKEEYLKNKLLKEEIIDKLLLMEDNIDISRRIINRLKYSQLISKDDISSINVLLRELGYNKTDVAFIVENLFLHNKDIDDKKDVIDLDDKYKFINLLSIGGETFDLPEVNDEITLSFFADSVFSVLEKCSYDILFDNYKNLFPVIGVDVKDMNELKFIIINVLKNINNSLNEKIDLIKDTDFIMDLELKDEIASECYDLIERYTLIRNYLDELSIKQNEVIDESPDINEGKECNNLFYLVNKNNKCYFISDVKDMPYEYISKVMELINKFRNNEISDKKNKKLFETDGFSELKDDQIRIIYKRIKDNNYLIYGAFIKKDDWKYRSDFKNVINRVGTVSDNPDELESELEEFITANQRKWSR